MSFFTLLGSDYWKDPSYMPIRKR